MRITTIFIFSVLGFSAGVCNANAEISPVEFRGYTELGDEQLFSLRSTQEGGSAWIHLGQSFGRGKLVDYNPLSKTITFFSQGETYRVKMFEATELEDVVTNFRTSNQQSNSKNVSRQLAPRRGALPRVSAANTYEEKSTKGTYRVNIFEAKELDGQISGSRTSDHQFDPENITRRLVPRRGTLPRVSTASTIEEKVTAGRIGYGN